MSQWPSSKARQVLAALLRIGWTIKRQVGSHRLLSRNGWPDYIFAFHDSEEIGPKMLSRIAKRTGLIASRRSLDPDPIGRIRRRSSRQSARHRFRLMKGESAPLAADRESSVD